MAAHKALCRLGQCRNHWWEDRGEPCNTRLPCSSQEGPGGDPWSNCCLLLGLHVHCPKPQCFSSTSTCSSCSGERWLLGFFVTCSNLQCTCHQEVGCWQIMCREGTRRNLHFKLRFFFSVIANYHNKETEGADLICIENSCFHLFSLVLGMKPAKYQWRNFLINYWVITEHLKNSYMPVCTYICWEV